MRLSGWCSAQERQCDGLGMSAGLDATEAEQRVREHVAFGVMVRRLLHAAHLGHLGQHSAQEPGRLEHLEAAPRTPFEQDLHDLVADALPGDRVDSRRESHDRGERLRFDLPVESGGEAHRAEQSKPVLVEARDGVADRADDATLEVRPAAHMVDRLVGSVRIEEHAVDGEVAALGITPCVGHVNLDRVAVVGIASVAPEGRDLDALAPLEHEHDPELHTDRDGARKDPLYLGRRSRGRDVVVERLASEQ